MKIITAIFTIYYFVKLRLFAKREKLIKLDSNFSIFILNKKNILSTQIEKNDKTILIVKCIFWFEIHKIKTSRNSLMKQTSTPSKSVLAILVEIELK